MNECANEEIAQDSKNTSRSTKLKSLVGKNSDPLSIKMQGFLNKFNLLFENDTSDVFKPY